MENYENNISNIFRTGGRKKTLSDFEPIASHCLWNAGLGKDNIFISDIYQTAGSHGGTDRWLVTVNRWLGHELKKKKSRELECQLRYSFVSPCWSPLSLWARELLFYPTYSKWTDDKYVTRLVLLSSTRRFNRLETRVVNSLLQSEGVHGVTLSPASKCSTRE